MTFRFRRLKIVGSKITEVFAASPIIQAGGRAALAIVSFLWKPHSSVIDSSHKAASPETEPIDGGVEQKVSNTQHRYPGFRK